LDRQWICATNQLCAEVNNRIQEWRSQEAPLQGTIRAVTELVTPLPESLGLSRCQQMDFLQQLDTPDLPLHVLRLFAGDALMVLRNLDPASGLAKGRRCSAKQLRNRTVVIGLDNGEERTLTRMPMEKVTNGMRFKRWQIPLRLMYAGTVHRSQGMTLARTVVDCRSNFWEHGQTYVALSRGRDPRHICILLPAGSLDLSIKVPCDREVVRVVPDLNQMDADALEFDCFEISNRVDISLGVLDTIHEEFEIEEEIHQIPNCDMSGDESTNSNRIGGDLVDRDQGLDEQAGEQGCDDLDNLGNVEWQVIIRIGVNSCLNSLVEAQKAKSSKCLFVHACDRRAVLCARILAAWRWAKEQSQSSPVIGDWERAPQMIGVGLLNTSNNCYINALVQVLFHLLSVRDLISSWPGDQSVAAQLRSVFDNLAQARVICTAFLGEICEP
jgi:hypothetical protein